MLTPLPYFKTTDYAPQDVDAYKLRVIKTPEAVLCFRKEYVARNNPMGTSIYYATDEYERSFIVKEYRTNGLKGGKKIYSRGQSDRLRQKALAELTALHARMLHVGSDFGPWGLCINAVDSRRCTRAYSFQRLLKGSLHEVLPALRATGANRYDIARFVGTDVARDLVRVHDRDVIHFDLKPENICLAEDRFVLIDFDISAEGPLGRVRGTTREYAPPEQVFGRWVGNKADVFPLGILLGELVQQDGVRLLGRMQFTDAGQTRTEQIKLESYLDFRSGTLAADGLRANHFRGFEATLADLHPAFEQLVRRCTHPDVERRLTAQEALAALTAPPLVLAEPLTAQLRAACVALPERSPRFAAHHARLQTAMAAARTRDANFGRRG